MQASEQVRLPRVTLRRLSEPDLSLLVEELREVTSIDLEYLRDLVVERYGLPEEAVDSHPLVRSFREAENGEDAYPFWHAAIFYSIEDEVDDPADIEPSARFVQDLGLDSLDFLALIMKLEDLFGVRISDEDAGRFVTVGDAVAFLAAYAWRDRG